MGLINTKVYTFFGGLLAFLAFLADNLESMSFACMITRPQSQVCFSETECNLRNHFEQCQLLNG